MSVQIAHFPSAKTFEEIELNFQPSRELADRLLFYTKPTLLVIDSCITVTR